VRRERRIEATRQRVGRLRVPQRLQDRFAKYARDPVGFVRVELGATPEPYQVAILEACVTDPRIAWRAAHGTGKTTTLAWVLCWWLLTRAFSRVAHDTLNHGWAAVQALARELLVHKTLGEEEAIGVMRAALAAPGGR
jgi:hypothetical protein